MKVVIDDCRLEKMDVYTDPLNDKIKRQAAEITRLLAENAELKKGREAIRDNAFEAGLIRGQEEAWELEKKNENKQKRIEKLVDRLYRQAAEITRLLAENEQLKKEKSVLSDCVDSYGIDIMHSIAAGQEEAWELARKIVCSPGYSGSELKEIFGNQGISWCISSNTYTEAAAKVAEWERKKEEICVGDVVECEEHCGVVVGVGECYIKGFTSDWTPFQWMKKGCTKTGRHIDVDAWLAQIGGEQG